MGLHHLRNGNTTGALSMLGKALRKLERLQPTASVIDVAAFASATRRCREAVEGVGSDVASFQWHYAPTVGFVGSDDL